MDPSPMFGFDIRLYDVEGLISGDNIIHPLFSVSAFRPAFSRGGFAQSNLNFGVHRFLWCDSLYHVPQDVPHPLPWQISACHNQWPNFSFNRLLCAGSMSEIRLFSCD
jgi:hypothetical protein